MCVCVCVCVCGCVWVYVGVCGCVGVLTIINIILGKKDTQLFIDYNFNTDKMNTSVRRTGSKSGGGGGGGGGGGRGKVKLCWH